MNIPNLTDLMISVTDFKKQIADIMKNKKTKVIVRNNEPVSIIIPYEEYRDMANAFKATGEPFVLSNGVVMKVLVEIENEQIAIKQYIQMKSTGEWKLHFTQYMGQPRPETAMTNEEIMASYQFRQEKEQAKPIIEPTDEPKPELKDELKDEPKETFDIENMTYEKLLKLPNFRFDEELIRKARKIIDIKLTKFSAEEPYKSAIIDILNGTPHMRHSYFGAYQSDQWATDFKNDVYGKEPENNYYINIIGLKPDYRNGLTEEEAKLCIYILRLHLQEATLQGVANTY